MDGSDTPSIPVEKTLSGSADCSRTLPGEPLRAKDAPRSPDPARALSLSPRTRSPRLPGQRGAHHAAQRCGGPGRSLLGCGGVLGTPRPSCARLWESGQEFPDRELAARRGRTHARAPAPAPSAGSRVSAASAAACQPGAAQAVPGRTLWCALGLPDAPLQGAGGAGQCLPALSPR